MNMHLDWRLGCQAWTFHYWTFFETIDRIARLGLRFLEAYPGQPLDGDRAVKFDHNLPENLLEEVQAKMAGANVTLVNYGVVPLPNDELECRKVFAFAKAVGIETIVSEPPAEALTLVDDLCQEYEVRVAIHNHPAPSFYWDPERVVRACEGRSGFMGACADTGHWVRSAVDPLEALRMLDGRIMSLHLKDVDRHAADALDVPWGQGVCRVDAILAELERQKFNGVISIEYEIPTDEDRFPHVARCVNYYRQAVAGRV